MRNLPAVGRQAGVERHRDRTPSQAGRVLGPDRPYWTQGRDVSENGSSTGRGDASENGAEALIRAAKAGSGSARDDLFGRYRNYLCLIARITLSRKLHAKLDASDLAQEALLKVHQGFDRFQGATEPELVAWLRQILSRTLIDVQRRYERNEGREVARERSLDAAVERSSNALGNLIPGHQTSPSRRAERRELSVVFADALAALEPDHREIVVLRNLEDQEWDEIARRMNRSKDAARMLWARALARLRPLIEERL